MFLQLILSSLVIPETLNFSRNILKNSQLQFIPSLLKEKEFNDTVEGLTIFVNKKNPNGEYEDIFIRDDGNILTKISSGSSTIFAKKGNISNDEKSLILFDGNIQKLESNGSINVITFKKTQLNLSGLSTKTISEPKIQETSTIQIVKCMQKKIIESHNCSQQKKELLEAKIEINKRFGMPLFIPLISLIACFLLASQREKKNQDLYKHINFLIGFVILMSAEITVRYSGISLHHTALYYLIPAGLFPLIYIFLIKKFKYENLY